MPTPFRPNVEVLDARELPSVTPFTFTLADGTVVSGSFDYDAAAVDAMLASQQVPVSDMVVALNGQPAVLAAELIAPAATFALGQFQAVSLTAVAVAGDVAALLDTAGTLSAVSVTNPAPPLNPITDPSGQPPAPVGQEPVDAYQRRLQILIEKYNEGLSELSRYTSTVYLPDLGVYGGILIKLMRSHDYWTDRRNEAKESVLNASGPFQQALAQAYLEKTINEIRAVELELRQAYSKYQAVYNDVVAQYTYFDLTLPVGIVRLLVPPPVEFQFPDDYLEYP